MNKSLRFAPFKVCRLFGEGYVVIQDGIIIGFPRIFDTKETAQKHAKRLNVLHGLNKKDGDPDA